MQVVLIGADPEVFLAEHGKIVPAVGRVPGSKEEPHKTEHGWVQPDNALAEFNIAPAATRDEFLFSIRAAMGDLYQYGDVVIQASHTFTRKELLAAGPSVFQFGCDPDFCAWNGGAPNRRPIAKAVGGLRTAGGHIHIGAQVAQERHLDVIKGCDVLLGLPSLYFDDDTMRRTVYGKAGAFRAKSYGVEYRTLSNFWLRTQDLTAWAYDQSIRVLYELDTLTEFCAEHGDAVQRAINTSDAALGRELLNLYANARL